MIQGSLKCIQKHLTHLVKDGKMNFEVNAFKSYSPSSQCYMYSIIIHLIGVVKDNNIHVYVDDRVFDVSKGFGWGEKKCVDGISIIYKLYRHLYTCVI